MFNTGKEIEAMKCLTLHRIASSLLLPSFATEWVYIRHMQLFLNLPDGSRVDNRAGFQNLQRIQLRPEPTKGKYYELQDKVPRKEDEHNLITMIFIKYF